MMANSWTKLRCVVEVKVPPGSPVRTKDLIYQVEQALLKEYRGNNIPLPRSAPMRHFQSRFRVLHFGKVVQADREKVLNGRL